MGRLACLWLGCALLAGAAPRRLVIVADGVPRYAICLSSQASPSERRGAAELQRFLEEISGAKLPLVGESPAPRGKLIFVGDGALARRSGARVPLAELGPEGFVLTTAGPHLVIAGGRQRGTMYGVYAFLEKLGCRWFTAAVSRIPKSRTIAVDAPQEMQKPAFEYREPFVTEAFDRDWAARNRTNGDHAELDETTGGKVQYYPFVHSFNKLVPPEKYFASHPEYFSLVSGRRRAKTQLCLTNPDVLRIATAQVLEWIREHPEATIFSVSQNDRSSWCECDACRHVEEEEGGEHSGPLLRFVNAIAAEVEKRHPGKLIDTLAYQYTEAPPLRARPRPNVRIRLCPIGACQAHPYEQCERTAYFMKNLRAWSRITNQLYVWHYNADFMHYLLPFPDFDELAADIPMYRRHGVVGLFMEGAYPPGGGGEMAELRAWVMARLLWDTRADAGREMDDFLRECYGPAAAHLRAYLELLHNQVRMPPAGRGFHMGISTQPGAAYLSREFLAEARRILDRAEAAADTEARRRRARKDRLSLDYVELWRAKEFRVRDDGWFAPADLDGLKRRFAAFLDAAASFGITNLHERRGFDWDRKEFERIRPYRAVTLENGALRLDLAPELSGRAVRLIHKASGAGAFRPVDSGERTYPDLGGFGVFVYPHFRGKALETRWRVEGAPGPDAVRLAGECGPLRLARVIRLEGSAVVTETTAENGGGQPAPAALQAEFDFAPGAPQGPGMSLAFRTLGGGTVDRLLNPPGVRGSGWEIFEGPGRPAGEWRAWHRGGGLRLTIRYAPEEAPRCFANWSPGSMVVAMCTADRTLAPGEKLRLTASYRLE